MVSSWVVFVANCSIRTSAIFWPGTIVQLTDGTSTLARTILIVTGLVAPEWRIDRVTVVPASPRILDTTVSMLWPLVATPSTDTTVSPATQSGFLGRAARDNRLDDR